MLQNRRVAWAILILAGFVAITSVLDSIKISRRHHAAKIHPLFPGEYRNGAAAEDFPLETFDSSETWSIGDVTLVNISKSVLTNVTYKCSPNAWVPKIKVCVFPESRDRFASKEIVKSGTWERRNTELFITVLAQYPDLDFIDIGANLGQYSLLAAGMKRKVLAVEPYAPSARRLLRSLHVNGFNSSDVVLVNDAITDHRGGVTLRTWRNTQSGVMVATGNLTSCDPPCLIPTSSVLMDDLLPVISAQFPNMTKSFLKMDIEGHEHKALSTSNNLFSKHLVAFILMEWVGMKEILAGRLGSHEDVIEINYMVHNLKHKGYDHYMVNRRSLLSPQFRLADSMWEHWPDDVLWIHKEYQPMT